jgi:signal transduction histidine kinase
MTASATADELEEANARLRAAYSEIAQLAGGLAHEIRNPLSTMRMNLDLLAEEFADDPEDSPRTGRIRRKLDRVRKESHRLETILEEFLRFARAQEPRRSPADLNAVVEEVRDFCEGQGVAQGIVSRTHFDPGLPRVPLDADLFKQALLNLMLNAQHAMPEGGELILTTRREGPWAVLDVTDTGVGIPPELQGRVFDAFVSTRSGGSGLGLPTTRKIVEAHGGAIALESEPGRGTRFTVRLPLGAS